MLPVLADQSLYQFTGGEPPLLDALERRYQLLVAGPPKGDEHWLNWVIRRTTDDAAVGSVQATICDHDADVAWLIGIAHQGQGFAVEAARAMCDWLSDRGIDRLRAHIHPRHDASQGVAAAIGLAATGDVDEGEQIWAAAADRRSPD